MPVLLLSFRPISSGAGKDQWANALRTAIFAASLVEYLTTGKLISLSDVGDILGSEPTSSHRSSFNLTFECSQGRMERSPRDIS